MTTSISSRQPSSLRLYPESLVDHCRDPYHFGQPAKWDMTASGSNRLCGDRVTFFAVSPAQGDVESLWFCGSCCMVCKAVASLLCLRLEGASADAARAELDGIDGWFSAPHTAGSLPEGWHGFAQLADFPTRLRCARLATNTCAKLWPVDDVPDQFPADEESHASI